MQQTSSNRRYQSVKRRRLLAELLEDRSLLAAMRELPTAGIEERPNSVERPYVEDEVIVAISADSLMAGWSGFLAHQPWERLTTVNLNQPVQPLLRLAASDGGALELARVPLAAGKSVPAAIEELQRAGFVQWAAPNYLYSGDDARDFIPNDSRYTEQYHHPLMKNDLAWDLTQGSDTVVVAVTDDGVDLSHLDLVPNLWINNDEISGDGIDNDHNGYIDDRNGWDFSSGDNDPSEVGTASHGTHVAGIIAAELNNHLGVAGTAGHATVMPLRFYGSGAWTSTVIAAAYAYAVDNGARIISTSYNVDSFVGDPVFAAGLQYLYDRGGLHFNSAGNNSQLNPPRQAFEQSLLVASTDENDKLSGFSNFGKGIDLAAPGSNILSTLPGNAYGSMSGTSMATPNAAAAAALIWSLHSDWTREQVVTQLLATADNIDVLNPANAGLMGSGRVNSYRALTDALVAPWIKQIQGLPEHQGTTTVPVAEFTVGFSQLMTKASAENLSNYELRKAGPDYTFDTADDSIISLIQQTNYFVGSNGMKFTTADGSLGIGKYRLKLQSGLQNPFDLFLDGNRDGAGGDAYVHEFTITVPPLKLAIPLGSLAATTEPTGAIRSALDQDTFTLELNGGQNLSVAISPATTLRPQVDIAGPGGFSRTVTAPAVGNAVQLSNIVLSNTGTYTFTIRGNSGSTGGYTAHVAANADWESEWFLGTNNNTPAAAENITTAFTAIPGTTISRALVLGNGIPELATVATESFETPLGSAWATASSLPGGRIRVSTSKGGASGSAALLMDTTAGNLTLNEAIWTVDLSGATRAELEFSQAEWNDEETPFQGDFVGSALADGVAISADGLHWHPILSLPQQTSGNWVTYTVDISTEAAKVGIVLGPTFRIKFQQYDDFALDTDGRAFDGITLRTGNGVDWYRLSLADGESLSAALDADDVSTRIELELYDASETSLAWGSTRSNIDLTINGFTDRTTNGIADGYLLRVIHDSGPYGLWLTRQAGIAVEPNSRWEEAQAAYTNSQIVGHVPGLNIAGGLEAQASGGQSGQVITDQWSSHPNVSLDGGEDDAVQRFIVKFRDQPSELGERSRLEGAGFEYVTSLPLIDAVVGRTLAGMDIFTALAFWRQQPDVVYAEPDYSLHADDIFPNDPSFASLYGLHNTGQSGGTPDADIDAPAAWQLTRGDANVVIAVIDTGVDYNHPDLMANMWVNPGETAGDGIDNDANGYVDDIYGIDTYHGDADPWDDQYHGTHVAGTIAAVGDNGVGITGVAWNARIMALKFLGPTGSGSTSGAVTALQYLTMMKTRYGVNVVASNNSWGGGGYSQALQDAIQASNNAGVLFVAAAGNSGLNSDLSPHYPAGYDLPGIVAVAATNHNDALAGFSTYGTTTVDLAAPGVSTYSTMPGNSYGNLSGTSMATPHVTGVVALMGAYNPAASVAELKAALLTSVDRLPGLSDKVVTGGRMNASAALQAIGNGDFFHLSAEAGDVLTLRTLTPDNPSSTIPNLIDPALELVDATGFVIATDANSAGDGRNALITYTVTQTGDFYAHVMREAYFGTYVLTLQSSRPVNAAPTVVASSPAPGETVGLSFPNTYSLNFSEGLAPSSAQASDLVVSGVVANSVRFVDGDTLEFTLNPAGYTGDGTYIVQMAANAVMDLQGVPSLPYSATFISDTTGPKIVSTRWNGSSLPVSRVLAAEPLIVDVLFDESIRNPVAAVVQLDDDSRGVRLTPNLIRYNDSLRELHLEFDAPPDGDYVLTLRSGKGLLEDLWGNGLNGEPLGTAIDFTPTGNSTAGGDYVVAFSVDVAAKPLPLLDRLLPLGSLVFTTHDDGAVSYSGDVDDQLLMLEANQTISVFTAAGESLRPWLELVAPNGSSLGWTSAAAGQTATLQGLSVPTSGEYRLRISGDAGSTGSYLVTALVNALEELSDSTAAIPLALGTLQSNPVRYAALGHVSFAGDEDYFSVNLTGNSGHALDVVLAGQTGVDFSSATLQLLDIDESTVLATASAAPAGKRLTNADLVIGGLIVPHDGVFRIRLTDAPVGDYVVALFDHEVFDWEQDQVGTLASRSVSAEVVATGFVGWSELLYYPFDEAVGNETANDAVIAAAPSVATVIGHALGGIGQVGGALRTQASTGASVNTGWNTSLGSDSWTISFWWDRSALPYSGAAQYVFGDPAVGGFRLFADGAAGPGNLLLRGPLTEVLIPGGAANSGPLVVTVIYDAAVGEIRGYVDGLEVVSVAQATLNLTGNGLFQLGYYNGTSLGTGVLLDEFRIFNRSLSAAEAATLTEGAMESDRFNLAVSAGEIVSVLTTTPSASTSLRGKRLDPELHIYGPDGTLVSGDFDSGTDGRNAVAGFFAAATGIYQLEVQASRGQGEYQLWVDNSPRVLLQLDRQSVREDEGNGVIVATLSRNTSAVAELSVALSVNDPSQLRVPATVTIPAGAASTTLLIDVLDNAILDGTREVSIHATASGLNDAFGTIAISDYETLTLSIAPSQIEDDDGPAAAWGTVARSNVADLSQAQEVVISGNNPIINTPTTVTIPAGASFVNFPIDAIDNHLLDGIKTVTLAVRANGYVGSSTTVVVRDPFGVAPGRLDPTFDFDGKLTQNSGREGSQFYATLVQPDGSIVGVGRTTQGDGSRFVVSRFLSDGTLDGTFGVGGTVKTTHPAGYYAYAYAAALQSDGKIVAAGFAGGSFALARYLTNGDLDPSFGSSGTVSTDFGSGTDSAQALAIQPDGKLVVAGYAYVNDKPQIALARYNDDGTLDVTFDGDGMTTISIGTENAFAQGIALQADGKMVVTGYTSGSSSSSMFVVRIEADGVLDPSFDGDGMVVTTIPGSSYSNANSIALQSDGKVVVGGYSNGRMVVVRYLSNGVLDTTFDGDGRAVTSGETTYAYAMAIQNDSRIVIAGQLWTGSKYDIAIVRWQPNGSLDNSFDGDGKRFLSVSPDADIRGLAVQSDGRIVVAGRAGNEPFVARLNATGSLDSAFDGDGMARPPTGSGSDRAYDVAIQADGKIVAVGSAYNGESNDFLVRRFLASGELDPEFGEDGKAQAAFYSYSNESAYTAALQPDGKILAAGDSFGAMRFRSDGTLDTTFDVDGKQMVSFSPGYGTVYAIAVQPDGKIVLGGYLWTGGEADFGLARLNADGSLDSSFGTAGKVITNFAVGGNEYLQGLAIQPDGKLIAVGYIWQSSVYDMVVARYLPSGILDTTFDGDGLLRLDLGNSLDQASDVVVQPDGKLVLLGRSGADYAFIRLLPDGSFDASFDGGGKVIVDVAGWDYSEALIQQVDGKLIGVGSSYISGQYDISLVRLNSSGDLDTTFAGGKIQTPIGTGDDNARGVALQTDGRIVVAGLVNSEGQDDLMVARYQGDGPLALDLLPLTVDEDTPSSVLRLRDYFADPTDPVDALTFSIPGNSNPTLFRDVHIDPATGELSVGFATNANGNAQLMLRATDPAGFYIETPWNITVNPVNDPPTITEIADQVTDESTPTLEIPFVLGDVETPPNQLSIAGQSSNPSLVPPEGIIFSGTGANRQITVVPVAGQFGTTVVTVVVSDARDSVSESFTVTVRERLQLNVLPNSIDEEGGVAVGTVSRRGTDLTQALVITLASSDLTEATVPLTVTIPIGQSSISFPVTALDDALLDGVQTVILTATAAEYALGTTTLQVTDVEQLLLSITPASISENGGVGSGSVTRSNTTDLSQALVVSLLSVDPTEATVPTQVTIPSGQSSVTFPVVAVDDALLDGTQIANITASAVGYFPGNAALDVTDSEIVVVSINVPSMSENGGVIIGTIRRSDIDDLSRSQVVTLTSDDHSEATVNATIVIPVGEVTATFPITAVDDTLLDGTQFVTITASAIGYENSNALLEVRDYEQLTLAAVSSLISENGGSTSITVSRGNSDTSLPVVVRFTNALPSSLLVPDQVTIPAGDSSFSFVASAIDDSLLDGTQQVELVAASEGYQSASLIVNVTDFERLTLTVDSTVLKETGITLGRVTRGNDNLSQELVVDLTNGDSTEVLLPPQVTIPSGQTSTEFAIIGVNDHNPDGPQRVNLMANATGYEVGEVEVDVIDDPQLKLSISTPEFSENGGMATITIERDNASVSTSLIVTVQIDDTSAAIAPVQVTIPAGEVFATFMIAGVNDNVVDGTQLASVSINAVGFDTVSELLSITDDDYSWQNSPNRFDVTNDGVVDIRDILALVYYFNLGVATPIPDGPPTRFYDVNGDRLFDIRDILAEVYYYNTFVVPQGEGEANATLGTQPIEPTQLLKTSDLLDLLALDIVFQRQRKKT